MMDFHSYLKLKPVLVFLSFTFLTACSPSLNVSNGPASYDGVAPNSMTIVPNQLPVPASFKSVQFYANDASGKAPIIELNSTDHLTLSFDELTDIIGQFRITFSHHDKTWNYSNIPQDWYLKGIGELIVGGGQKSNSRGPDYIHYEIKITQNKVQFISSGNYLLHVSDANSGQTLFSLPFYVTENAGELSSTSQTLFNSGSGFTSQHRLFSNYTYPDFVTYPEFDLSFAFVQNRFWADTRFTESYDFNSPGIAKFDLSQSNAFPANIVHIVKDLNSFSQTNYDIKEWNPGTTPPKVVLREDVLNFLDQGSEPGIRTYQPESSVRSGYANTVFRLDGDDYLTEDDKVYLLGEFNQWTANDNSKMRYDPDTGLWELTQLLKEGSYSYKYVRLDKPANIDLTSLSDNSSPVIQEYMSMIYFNDPDRKFDRLLKIETFYAR